MPVFVRKFECDNQPVTVTFTPQGKGLLAVTAEIEGRVLEVIGLGTAQRDPNTGVVLLTDSDHLYPGRYPTVLKLYKRAEGIYEHEICKVYGIADFTSTCSTVFELNEDKTKMTIYDSTSLEGEGGPP